MFARHHDAAQRQGCAGPRPDTGEPTLSKAQSCHMQLMEACRLHPMELTTSLKDW